MPPAFSLSNRSHSLALILIASLLALRLLLVLFSPLELYADEAQYWRWSDQLAWGYYSKPPMIAWLIGIFTSVLGDSVWAIRIAAPCLHAITACVLYLLACRMFSPIAALFTLLIYVFMPGVVLSSSIISTDGVLFPFWALTLYLYWRLREQVLNWSGVAGLGLVLGLGFLAKYAMIYSLIGIGLTMLLDRPSRQAVISKKGALMLGTAFLVILPHIIWNALNGFETVSHTVDNANLGGPLLNPEHFPEFLADQMAVFGPVPFIFLLAALFIRRPDNDLDELMKEGTSVRARERWLACFILPVLIIIAVQAVLSRAHANWAATAYPAASLLVGSFMARHAAWRPVFWAGLGLQIVLMVMMAVLALGPPNFSAALGRDNDFKRVRGWQDISEQLMAEVDRLKPTILLTDEREVWHGLDYYTRDQRQVPLLLWRYHDGPRNFAEKQDLAGLDDSRVLVASYRSHLRPRIKADFASWEKVGELRVSLGHRSNGCPLFRELQLYLVSDYKPLKRDQAWLDRFRTLDDTGQRVNMHIDQPPICPPLPDMGAD